jgi:phage host-nuclease inhibitor protein Gam
MASPSKTRLKKTASAVSVPQNREQAAAAIRELGVRQRELARIAADMNDALALVKEGHEACAEPLRQRIEALAAGVQAWSEANRELLTQNGRVKTVLFTTGEIAWRLRPPSVRVTGQEAVLDLLRRMGLTRFIREKQEINKEAVLNDPEAVSGVAGLALLQGEDFIVTPFEAELSGGLTA